MFETLWCIQWVVLLQLRTEQGVMSLHSTSSQIPSGADRRIVKQHGRVLSAVIRRISAFNLETSVPLCVYGRMKNWAHPDVSDITNKTSLERFWSIRNINPLQSCSRILNRFQKSWAEIHTGHLGNTTAAVRWWREVMTAGSGIITEPICILTGSFRSSAETECADPQPFLNQISWIAQHYLVH